MIKMYISNNRSSRNAKKFFNDYSIPVMQIKIDTQFSKKELLSILEKNPDDLTNILSLKSKNVKELIKSYDNLSLSDLMNILINNPSFIKTPIIFDEKRFLAGFNSEDIRVFIPR